LVLIVTLWGSYPAATKLALRDFPPFFLAAARCTLASAFLVVGRAWAGVDLVRGLSPGALRAFLILGLTGIWGSTQLTYVAIHYTTASNAVLLQAATPVLVALAARLWLGERVAALGWGGVALSALGALLVITDGRLATIRPGELRGGDFINLVALTGWSAYTVYGKRVLTTYPPALTTTAAYVLGTALIIPTAIAAAPFYPAPRLDSGSAWAVIVYQAILGAVAHVWWYRAVQVVGPSRSAIFMNLQPIVGVLLAATLLGEQTSPWQMVGGALVLAGVALTTRERF
jgi:drug/metabolite transporter (DMT)-like permease